MGQTTYAARVLADSPLGYWKIVNDTTGSATMADSSGSARNGTYTNGPVRQVAGPYNMGNCVTFDGVDDRSVVANNAAWNVTVYTIEAIVKDPTSLTMLARDDGPSAFTSRQFRAYATASSIQIRRYGTNNTAVIYSADCTFVSGKWHHVALSYNSSSVQFFFDGEQISSQTTGVATNTPALDLTVGCVQNGAGAYNTFGSGAIQHIAFYGSKIGATRVKAHYDAFRSSLWNDLDVSSSPMVMG